MMIHVLPNYHPIFVHFTVALMVVSLAMLLVGYLFKAKPIFHKECFIVSRWCLWLAALSTILTVIAGFHAYFTVAHDAASHEIMTIHRNWGLATFVIIWAAAIWSFVLHIKNKPPKCLFTLSLVIAVAMVMVTGWYGGELVYRHGVGVKSLPKTGVGGHHHVNGDHSISQTASHHKHDH